MEALRPGDPASVGGYRLLGRLGAGGMGQVFLGVSPGGRKVAVKLIHPVHAQDGQFRERFAREIEAAARVGGFHTAPVVDADPRADPPWMVTAYIEGPSLQEAVGQDGPLPPGRVRALGAGLAEGLAAIHARGLVHRDLKPGNVIMAADGPRIIDFGIARVIDASTGITSTGAVVGTFAYMSPEQLRGQPAGPASDVFALGCVLGFAATGRPPFGADQAATVMFRILTEPPDLAGLANGELREMIAACLAKAPGDRPPVRAALSAPGPVPVLAGARAGAVPIATADGYGTSTQTHAPVPPTTAPWRDAPPPPPATGTGRPPAPASPPAPAGAVHARPSRRRPAALVAAAALAVALAIALPILFTRATPTSAAGYRPTAGASVSSAATRPAQSGPGPTASHSRKPEPTASTTTTASPAGTPPTEASPTVAAPAPATAQRIAYDMLPSFGWSTGTYFGCLDDLWNRVSGWRYNAENASGAYGIPQALPGSKMASAGPDWQTDPATQIKWGLGYIKQIYGNPCNAWAFLEANGYY